MDTHIQMSFEKDLNIYINPYVYVSHFVGQGLITKYNEVWSALDENFPDVLGDCVYRKSMDFFRFSELIGELNNEYKFRWELATKKHPTTREQVLALFTLGYGKGRYPDVIIDRYEDKYLLEIDSAFYQALFEYTLHKETDWIRDAYYEYYLLKGQNFCKRLFPKYEGRMISYYLGSEQSKTGRAAIINKVYESESPTYKIEYL